MSVLRGNMVATLLDAGLLFLLRFSLDDSVGGVMSAAVHALRALLVSSEDEVTEHRPDTYRPDTNRLQTWTDHEDRGVYIKCQFLVTRLSRVVLG